MSVQSFRLVEAERLLAVALATDARVSGIRHTWEQTTTRRLADDLLRSHAPDLLLGLMQTGTIYIDLGEHQSSMHIAGQAVLEAEHFQSCYRESPRTRRTTSEAPYATLRCHDPMTARRASLLPNIAAGAE